MNTDGNSFGKPLQAVNFERMNDDERTKWGKYLMGLAIDSGIKRTYLAEKSGVVRKTLYSVARGERPPQASTLNAIRNALLNEVSTVDLWRTTASQYSDATQLFESATTPIFEQLSEDGKEAAFTQIVSLLSERLFSEMREK